MTAERNGEMVKRLSAYGTFTPHFDFLAQYRTEQGKKLGPVARVVFGFICRYSLMRGKVCRAATSTYEEETGFGGTAIRDAWKELLAEGLIQEVTPEANRSTNADGKENLTGVRWFLATSKALRLASASTPNDDRKGEVSQDERGERREVSQDERGEVSQDETEETSVRRQKNPQTPRTFSSGQNTNQGRDRKHQQFRGAGRNAKALKQAMLWDDDDNAQGKAPGLAPSTVTEVNPPAASRAPIVVTRVPDRSQRPTSDRGVGVEREDGVIKI